MNSRTPVKYIPIKNKSNSSTEKMAQKINPLAFRCLNNFEDSFCQQQVYKRSSLPYALQENKKVMLFIRRFFKTFNLVLHSFKFVKTSQGIAHLSVKYVPSQSRGEKDFNKFVNFSTLENAFLYSFSRFFSTTPILVSFFNLDKGKKKGISTYNNKRFAFYNG